MMSVLLFNNFLPFYFCVNKICYNIYDNIIVIKNIIYLLDININEILFLY